MFYMNFTPIPSTISHSKWSVIVGNCCVQRHGFCHPVSMSQAHFSKYQYIFTFLHRYCWKGLKFDIWCIANLDREMDIFHSLAYLCFRNKIRYLMSCPFAHKEEHVFSSLSVCLISEVRLFFIYTKMSSCFQIEIKWVLRNNWKRPSRVFQFISDYNFVWCSYSLGIYQPLLHPYQEEHNVCQID